MNKRGASKGKVLVIALDDNPQKILQDNEGYVLCFDTFKQIANYCFEENIDIDSVILYELDKETGKDEVITIDDIEEVEF